MTAAVLRTPIIVGTNENLSARFEFLTDGQPVSLIGHTASFGMRKVGTKGPADLTATMQGGRVLVTAPNVVVVDIPPSDPDEDIDLDQLSDGVYDFEVMTTSPEGKKKVRVRGTIELKMGIAP